MEPRFGRDFGGVRVHADPAAAESARQVGALAYAVGPHVVFGEGRYAPSTPGGRHLLAHELAHVVQQGEAAESPRLQRFGSEEHVRIGDTAVPGQTIDIGTNVGRVTYGELIALAGDYFESVGEVTRLANDIYGAEEVKVALWKVNPAVRPRPLVGQNVEDRVMDRYYRLAARNETHFSTGSAPGRSNREQYVTQHADAISAAYAEGASGIVTGPSWQAREAFSNHFLTDAFSGGHVRTPRGQVQSHWNGLYPGFKDNLMRIISCYMASHINERDAIGNVASVDKIASKIIPDLQAKAGNVLDAFSIGDLISKVMHDADSAGLDVVSPRGPAGTTTGSPYAWRAVGDDKLYPSNPALATAPQMQTQQMVTEAVRLSFDEARMAYSAGASHGTGAALATLVTPASFRALSLLPTANPASTTNAVYSWRAADIRALPSNLQLLLIAAFAPGTEIRGKLDGLSVPCITVTQQPCVGGWAGCFDWDLHTGDAWCCFKNMLLADPFGTIARICEGTDLCPPGQNDPCPGRRNNCPTTC